MQLTGAVSKSVEPRQFVLVQMRETADLSQEAALPRGPERRAAVWQDLVDTAARTQAPALDAIRQLQDSGLVLASRSVPIGNALVVTAKRGSETAVADALRGVAEIGSVLTHGTDAYELPAPGAGARPVADPAAAAPDATGIEWGPRTIGAPAAWAQGFDGTGVTIGIVDSGLDHLHPALTPHYRGTQADGSFAHDYNWIDTEGYASGTFAPAPFDDNGHGTHVAGSAAGGTQGDAIGVAPGAKVISSRVVFSEDMRSPVSTLDALQFMLAPTKTDGSAPDPRKGADVINNSWSASPWEENASLRAFDVLKAAGMLIVNSAGNNGPEPATVGTPGGLPGHITVAATDATDGVARFSSSGPSKWAPDAVIPQIGAPGVAVRSAVPGGGFGRKNGTSMASPHVTGAVALMLQAKPDASYDQIIGALQSTATDIAQPGIDARTGFGRINVDAAIGALLASDSERRAA